MKVFKSRFVAYKFFKDGKRIPGLLTVAQTRLVPEFDHPEDYIASWPVAHQGNHSVFDEHNKANVIKWARYKGADRVQRIIVESSYAHY